jgi:tryptophan-rich sensory protein
MLLNLAWMPVVNGYRKVTWGIFMIAAMIGLTGLMLVYDKNPSRKALLVPYMTWLLVAILLNVELSQITNVVARDW